MNEVMRLVLWVQSFATEVVLLFKLGKNEVLKSALSVANRKNDVRPFIKNTSEMDIWSTDYFLQLVDRINFTKIN
ncbi:hypothetical protein FACS1894123_08680 [Bacteroidia bacterium]|nr:hypothetical protein FACS1894123_08680 [Bacteroidia bacterium]